MRHPGDYRGDQVDVGGTREGMLGMRFVPCVPGLVPVTQVTTRAEDCFQRIKMSSVGLVSLKCLDDCRVLVWGG